MNITQLLPRIESGDRAAAKELLPLVYKELRVLAAHKLANEKPGQTLQPTALVHEAYIRLVGHDEDKAWDNRGHFFSAAAEAMRRILVERARRKNSDKHGGGRHRFELHDAHTYTESRDDELLALDESLDKLASQQSQAAELVKLRFFAGLSVEQAAGMLGISERTARRKWVYARAWLRREMRLGEDDRGDSILE